MGPSNPAWLPKAFSALVHVPRVDWVFSSSDISQTQQGMTAAISSARPLPQLLVKGHAIYHKEFFCGRHDFSILTNLCKELDARGEGLINWSQVSVICC